LNTTTLSILKSHTFELSLDVGAVSIYEFNLFSYEERTQVFTTHAEV